MSETPSPESTLVIVLGASTFPYGGLTSSESFKRSANRLHAYLVSKDGFGLPQENLFDLFDEDLPASRMDGAVADFLQSRMKQLTEANTRVTDLIVYYVGHGGFSEDGAGYYLAIKDSQSRNLGHSSYPIKVLARTLKEQARYVRKFLILDSCFAATAYEAFMSTGPLEVVKQQTLAEFPEKGTALLCASGPKEPAKAPKDEMYTMFSGVLLDVLDNGSPEDSEWFTLKDLGDIVRSRIFEKYADEAVRPQVLAPDQGQGEIWNLPLFPNQALRSRRILDDVRRMESALNEWRHFQSSHTLLHDHVDEEIKSLRGRLNELAETITAQGSRVSAFEMTDKPIINQYGMTSDEWRNVPPQDKLLVHDYWFRRRVNIVWYVFCAIICLLSWLPLMVPSYEAEYLDALLDGSKYAFVMCAFMAIWTLTAELIYIVGIRRAYPNSRLGTENYLHVSPSPTADSGMRRDWESSDIIVAARRNDAAVIIPGLEIGRRALAFSTVAYCGTVICILAIRLGWILV
jgi:hypothetical protein